MANEDFFMKIYGYYYSDKGFAYKVASRLLQLGRKDTIREYNQWLARYYEQENAMLKEVAKKQIEELNDWYEREVKKHKKYNKGIKGTPIYWT